MNIVFLLNSTFPYYSGGRENWLYYISDRLINRGHNVFAITIKPDENATKYYNPNPELNLVKVSIPFLHDVYNFIFRGPLAFVKHGLVSYFYRKNLKNILKPISGPKFVISLDTIVTPLALEKSLLDKVSYICASKGPHAEVMSRKMPFLKHFLYNLEKRAYSIADDVWSNGYDMKKYINKQGFDSFMVGNGIDSQTWKQKCKIPKEYKKIGDFIRIVSIGTILEIKGVSEAINAVAMLSNRKSCQRSFRSEPFSVVKIEPHQFIF